MPKKPPFKKKPPKKSLKDKLNKAFMEMEAKEDKRKEKEAGSSDECPCGKCG